MEQVVPAQASCAVDEDAFGFCHVPVERVEQILQCVFDRYVCLRMESGGTLFRRPFLAAVHHRFGALAPKENVLATLAMAEGFARFLLKGRDDAQQSPREGGPEA